MFKKSQWVKHLGKEGVVSTEVLVSVSVDYTLHQS